MSLRQKIEQLGEAEKRLQTQELASESTQQHLLVMMAQELFQLRQVKMHRDCRSHDIFSFTSCLNRKNQRYEASASKGSRPRFLSKPLVFTVDGKFAARL